MTSIAGDLKAQVPASVAETPPGPARDPAQAPPLAPLSDRELAANDIRLLAAELSSRDRPTTEVLGQLADAVEQSKTEEARAYAGAIDAKAVAEVLASKEPMWVGWVEVVRASLIFAPILVTWFGLSRASDSYQQLLDKNPDAVTVPFLLLWQRNFNGVGGAWSFSALATLDVALIGVLIAASVALHIRSEIRDPRPRARILLKESQVRRLLARSMGLSSSADISANEADEILDVMVEEERRVYERALESEGKLFDLERVVQNLQAGASQLANFAESTRSAGERSAKALESLLQKIEGMSDREGMLTAQIAGLATRIGDAASGSAVIVGSASSALEVIEASQSRIRSNASQLVSSLDSVEKVQQRTNATIATQADALSNLAQSLTRVSDRVESATASLVRMNLPSPAASANQGRGGSMFNTVVATLTLLVVIGAGVLLVLPRFVPSDSQIFVRDAQAHAQGVEPVQSLRLSFPAQRNADADAALRGSVERLGQSASSLETWLASKTVPVDDAQLASSLHSVASAVRRATDDVIKWLDSKSPDGKPLTETTPPASVLAEIDFADAQVRDLNLQFALLAAK